MEVEASGHASQSLDVEITRQVDRQNAIKKVLRNLNKMSSVVIILSDNVIVENILIIVMPPNSRPHPETGSRLRTTGLHGITEINAMASEVNAN